MDSDKELFDRVAKFASEHYDAQIKFKNESWMMKLLGKALFFNSKFMTRFVTVVGKKIYFPSREKMEKNPGSTAQVLCHEMVHMDDERIAGSLMFRLSYLLPQWLALLSVSSIFVGPIGLAFLVFFLPWPSFFRTFWELRGYAVTDAVQYELTGRFTKKEWMSKQFTSSSYFFMWPFSKLIGRKIEENRELIKKGQLPKKIPVARDILNLVSGE
jgi:hypothetical protein